MRTDGVEVVFFPLATGSHSSFAVHVAVVVSLFPERSAAVRATVAVGERVRFHVAGEYELGFITHVVAFFAEPPVFVAIEGFEGAVVGVDEMCCQLGLGIAGEWAAVAGKMV